MNQEQYDKGYQSAIDAIKAALQGGGKPFPPGKTPPQDPNNPMKPIPIIPKHPLRIGDKGDEEIQQQEAQEREKDAISDDAGNKIEGNRNQPDPKAVEARIKALKDILKDPTTADAANTEDNQIAQKRKLDRSARDAARYRNSPLQKFKQSMQNFIRDAVADFRGPTWAKVNKKYYGSGILRPGSTRHSPNNIPLINVYFDVSGSWDDKKIAIGEQAVATLNQYVRSGKIKIKLYYFACSVQADRSVARAEGGTRGAPILRHIEQTQPNNVIIMTDSDISDCDHRVTVPGAVWLLFVDGVSQNLQNNIKGQKLTRSFEVTYHG